MQRKNLLYTHHVHHTDGNYTKLPIDVNHIPHARSLQFVMQIPMVKVITSGRCFKKRCFCWFLITSFNKNQYTIRDFQALHIWNHCYSKEVMTWSQLISNSFLSSKCIQTYTTALSPHNKTMKCLGLQLRISAEHSNEIPWRAQSVLQAKRYRGVCFSRCTESSCPMEFSELSMESYGISPPVRDMTQAIQWPEDGEDIAVRPHCTATSKSPAPVLSDHKRLKTCWVKLSLKSSQIQKFYLKNVQEPHWIGKWIKRLWIEAARGPDSIW